jgi:hypothetical protein
LSETEAKMTSEKQPAVQIVWHQVSIVERFSSVLYPLDLFELLKQIPSIGYVVPELVLRGGSLAAGRPLATKGDIDLLVNQDNKTIGVMGRDIEKALASFEELREFYLERLDPSPGLTTQYLEIDAQGWAKAKLNPVEVFSALWANHAPLQDLGKLLEQDVSNYGLALVPRNKDPNDPNWFHIEVEPLVVSSSKRYRVRWIWRNSDIEELIKKLPKVDATLQELILRIERY